MAILLQSEWKITVYVYSNTRGATRYGVRIANTERARPAEIDLKPFILPSQALEAALREIGDYLDGDDNFNEPYDREVR